MTRRVLQLEIHRLCRSQKLWNIYFITLCMHMMLDCSSCTTRWGCSCLPTILSIHQKCMLYVITFYTFRIQFLRHMKDLFQLMYKIEVKEDDLELAEDVGEVDTGRESVTRQVVTLSCVGIGFLNYSKGIM